MKSPHIVLAPSVSTDERHDEVFDGVTDEVRASPFSSRRSQNSMRRVTVTMPDVEEPEIPIALPVLPAGWDERQVSYNPEEHFYAWQSKQGTCGRQTRLARKIWRRNVRFSQRYHVHSAQISTDISTLTPTCVHKLEC